MDVVYKHKHKKAYLMSIQFRKWNKLIHVYSKLGIDLLKLDMKILKANCQIVYYTIGDWMNYLMGRQIDVRELY
jgi:hypothetical protein